ncbi:hypothetical protein CHI07_20605 [Paenibacillus sp. 7884-2]|nr:hypothetical protein CHI07_20605 [Paenibacillus sp. 7884-2]
MTDLFKNKALLEASNRSFIPAWKVIDIRGQEMLVIMGQDTLKEIKQHNDETDTYLSKKSHGAPPSFIMYL